MHLSKLKTLLDKRFGKDWYNWEVETLSLEIGAMLDDITYIKMLVLKAIESHPDTITNDADYFLRFVEIANGNAPDPHHHDIPTSLELAFALTELQEIIGEVKPTDCIKEVSRYVLDHEGHGEAYDPILAKFSGRALVTNEKSKASAEYIKHMKEGK